MADKTGQLASHFAANSGPNVKRNSLSILLDEKGAA
jgi:hypothetical protein